MNTFKVTDKVTNLEDVGNTVDVGNIVKSIIVYDRALSESEINTVRSYLSSKSSDDNFNLSDVLPGYAQWSQAQEIL